MNRIFFTAMAILLPLTCVAEGQRARLQYPSADMFDLLALYEKLSNRKIWIAMGVRGYGIKLQSDRDLPYEEAIRLIRQALLDQCAIELKDRGGDEAFVDWSADPAKKELKIKMQTGSPALPPSTGVERRIRVINPK